MKAILRHVRVTPRKLSLMADEVRGKPVARALEILRFSPRRRLAELIEGAVKSAVANADQKGTVDADRLVIREILVGKGPTLKRFMPRAKGSASGLLKRTSHLMVRVAEE